MIRKGISLLALALCLVSPLFAQINKPDFSNVTDMVLNGSAIQAGNEVRLTNTSANQFGWAWFQNQQVVRAGFDTTFQFRITPGPVLAEGFAFIIQNATAGTGFSFAQPWTLGYGNLPNSLAIEFDTFNDGFLSDTSNNELSVHTRGQLPNDEDEAFSIGRITPSFNVSDGQPHTMRINYLPGTLEVFIDNLTVPLLSIPYDFATGGNFLTGGAVGGLSLPNDSAWVGFGATTGAGQLNERVEIIDWIFTPTNPLDPCFAGNVSDGQGGLEDVLTVNGGAGGFFRTVTTNTFEPFSIEMQTPSLAGGSPMPFGILGLIGAADGSVQGTTVFGPICFPIHVITPTAATFTLTENFGLGSPALLPSTPTPWTFSTPLGLTFPTTFTLQGYVQTLAGDPNSVAPTNAVIVEVLAAPAPTITTVPAPTGTPGTPLTIAGTNFSTNVTVTVDGNTVAPISVSPSAVVIPEPATLICGGSIDITNADGQNATAPFNPAPSILNTINSSGSAAGGGIFILQGQNFGLGATVTIGGTPANVTTASPFVVICQPPAGAVGPATVVLTTPAGCTATTTYTYF